MSATMNATDVIELEAATIALMSALKSDFNYALATRYLCLTGLVILVYDHCITFRLERRLVWTAPSSVAKFGFLFNRYLVPACMVVVFVLLSGFVGMDVSDGACRSVILAVSLLVCISLALGNGLIAMRIIGLWDYNPRVAMLAFSGWGIAYSAAIVCFSAALATRLDDLTWNPLLNICVLAKSSPLLIPAWAIPLTFELCVLFALLWNNVDRPRKMDITLARSLHQDGLSFFLMMVALRVTQLGLVSTQKPPLIVLGSFFIWALVTTTSSRWLLSWIRTELAKSPVLPNESRTNIAFDIRPHSMRMQDMLGPSSKDRSATPTPIELNQVVEVQKWAD